jgi:Tol biopolymer transport system component
MANIAIISLILFTQYFGQNKIQYRDFDFKILETEHFDIYFYTGGEELAAFAEEVLEDGYAMISEDLGVEVEFRIPAILYNSPNDFSQTNITLELIEEAVGGFSEILKNRMVVPFTGDYEEFRHVLVHELTHIFQFTIFFPSRLEALFSGDIFYSVPLWVLEGQCEFESLEWTLEDDIFVKDLIVNNRMIPLQALENYGGYIIYKQGQAFFNYVADRYGREKTAEFVHLLKAKKNLRETFIALFGVTIEDFNDQMITYYQLRYWPQITLKENFNEFARVVFDHKKTNSLYNTSTAISPQGDKIAFISDRTGTAEIIIISSIDGQVLKKLVTAEYSAGYEGLHLYQGGLSWSSDGQYITFAAKSRGTDVLYILNATNGEVYKKFTFDLDGIVYPHFSPQKQEIVFSGLKDGASDIYVLDIDSESLEQLTDDLYTDSYPSMSADGAIVFVSDRPDSTEEWQYGSYAIFVHDGNDINRLTKRTTYVASPFFDPHGGVFFVADYDSVYNLYFYSADENNIVKRTDILTGIYYPTISSDGSKIAFSYYNDYGYDVCVVKEPLDEMVDVTAPEERISEYTYEEAALRDENVKPYRTRFTFDYFVASAAYYSVLGFSGVGQIALSDILGNHYIQFSSNFYGSLTSSDIFLSYWYLKKRTDFGGLIFQYLNYFAEYPDLLIWRYLGIGGMAQYPIDRFFRVEVGAYAYKVFETRWYNYFPFYRYYTSASTNYNFFYPSLAFVFDNIKWGPVGPHKGRRVRLEGYATLFSDFDIRSVTLDYRRYFELSPRASFATRLVLAGSFGPDVDYWSIGGPGTLRGFDYYALTGSKLGFLNLEYRFPFVDYLKISVPLPIVIRNIRGVLFADFGGVYTDSFTVYETENGFRLKDLKADIGFGLRFNFLFMIFKLDWARSHDFRDFTDDWKFYLTLGPEW